MLTFKREENPNIKIGRSRENSICLLYQPYVHRSHSTISFQDGQLYLKDIHESNSIWIKEQNEDITTFIRQSHLEKGHLMDVSIYQLDRNNEPILRMEAVSANIKNSTWILKGVR